jgi:hypothetical protein
MLGISWVAAQLVASRVLFNSTELLSYHLPAEMHLFTLKYEHNLHTYKIKGGGGKRDKSKSQIHCNRNTIFLNCTQSTFFL